MIKWDWEAGREALGRGVIIPEGARESDGQAQGAPHGIAGGGGAGAERAGGCEAIRTKLMSVQMGFLWSAVSPVVSKAQARRLVEPAGMVR